MSYPLLPGYGSGRSYGDAFGLDACKNTQDTSKGTFKKNSPCDDHAIWKTKTVQSFKSMPANDVTAMIDRDTIVGALPDLCTKDTMLYQVPVGSAYSATAAIFQTRAKMPQKLQIPILRMWGFANCTQWESQAVTLYDQATHIIAMAMQQTYGESLTDVIIQYDGDAAYEKKNNKLSHNLMVSVVADHLKKMGIKCHLVISKVDSDDLTDLMNKFGELAPDRTSMRMRTNLKEFKDGVAHFYPNHTDTYFESITLLLQKVDKPPKGGPYPPSEPANMTLVQSYLQSSRPYTVSEWNCLCMGGNTQSGIQALSNNIFRNTVRGYLAAMS